MLMQYLLFFLALLITFLILRKIRQRPIADHPSQTYQVKFDQQVIEVITPTGQHTKILWQEISKIVIKTTDKGPLKPDLFWQFYISSETPAIEYPEGTIGADDLLAALADRFTTFNYQALLNAMSCTENNHFILWQKKR